MQDKFEKSVNNLRSMRLDEEEKKQMLANIKFAMHEEHIKQNIFVLVLRSIFIKHALVASIIAVVILSSVGIGQAAENSLPGDTLYPIKLNVNERLKKSFARTPEAKAKIESELTVKRLKEAEKLKEQGKLDEKRVEDITKKLNVHTEKIEKHIEEVHLKGSLHKKIEIEDSLEVDLSEHKQILEKLSEEEEGKDEFSKGEKEKLKKLKEKAEKGEEKKRNKHNKGKD